MKKKFWLVTGISSGLGKALAEAIMERGDFVIGTFRQQEQVDTFNNDNKENGFALKLDLAKDEEIANAVKLIIEKFGKIDVLVNNAGYGMAGAIEETTMEEVRSLFEVNLFGALELTQQVLPHMRKEGEGQIIQISSHGGFKAFAGFGIYNATKFALEGFSEALAQEIIPLGLKVTIVEPGPFRTRFAGEGFVLAKNQIPDYHSSAGTFREKIKLVDGKQEGDPKKAAAAIYNLSKMDVPPLRLPLGRVAIASIYSKLESVRIDLEANKITAEAVVYK